jgi:hypothetical protein
MILEGRVVCNNCKSETNGLKLNNRLYCTECGFLLSAPEPTTEAELPEIINSNEATIESKVGDFEVPKISEEAEEFSLAPLEAEEEVLDLVIDKAKELEGNEDKHGSVKSTAKAKLPKTSNTIKKHNRHRTDLKKEGDFTLIPGEPDPIAEPEIEAPEVDTAQNEITDIDIPVIVEASDKEEVEEKKVEPVVVKDIEEPKSVAAPVIIEAENVKEEKGNEDSPKQNPNNEVLLKYFQKQVDKGTSGKKQTKKKKKKGFKWGLFWAITIPVIVVLCLIGLVLYVNLYAGKPEVALERAEQRATFAHLKADYIPAGYTLSYKTNGSEKQIEYVYEYQPEPTRTIIIRAEKTNLLAEDIRPKVIDPLGKTFINITESGRSLWIVGDNSLYFIENGILYTITSSGDITNAELIKIAVGLK